MSDIFDIQTRGEGPTGQLPLTEDMLRNEPSGNLFGLTQSAGMGWDPAKLTGDAYLILNTHGGVRAEDGRPVALGYHTGHWEIGLLVQAAAETFREDGCVPYAAHCSDPCDGRTQGTTGMFDSLPYRNDAAIVMRRQIRSLPTRKGVVGVATCDKGLPAMMMALAGMEDLPCVLVPGGVTLPPKEGEDAGTVQTIGARFSHGMLSLDEAASLGCKACGSPGGGCQFFGTAATAQVVSEALGLSPMHSALAPSGSAVWRQVAVDAAKAVRALESAGVGVADIITDAAIRNAMVVHAAFGGSTNLLLHIPAIAHAAGVTRPTVDDWADVNAATPRLVSVLPNGPVMHPTVNVFLAGGVPEVMLHLRELGLLNLEVPTVCGQSWGEMLEEWEGSERRERFREVLKEKEGVDADDVILPPVRAEERGLVSTVTFPRGNLAPEGSVIKSTAIDPAVVDEDGVYRKEGPVKMFASEAAAIEAIRGGQIQEGDVMVLAGIGPMGTGMEETYQVTSALKFLPFGKHVAVVTDGRFSGVSTGACIGHVGPEALAGGPIGRLRDGDRVRIVIDRNKNTGTVDYIGGEDLMSRPPHEALAPHEALPEDSRLWAVLQGASGGTWSGCVYDVDSIVERLSRQSSVVDGLPVARGR
ncbi:MAG: YjhG/YagF family D-xylonate dehydratase [Verrucomicrobiales bacterium]|nr:YjhG/YagF family D-xylonate dehydratase [Verrucomicrobiales bacterium]|tara:strand:+ start:22841 stop:24766 length:1926 start_codon:yes stop_codon:yes gene_type:complete